MGAGDGGGDARRQHDQRQAVQLRRLEKRVAADHQLRVIRGIDFDLLFRWFVGLGIEDPVRDATTFTKNRDRLLDRKVGAKFLAVVLSHDKSRRLLSSDHFCVDGTLLEAGRLPPEGRFGLSARRGQ